jgi:hypothetical protein
VFFGVFIAEDIDGIGDKVSEDTKKLMCTLGTLSEHVPEICLFH